MSTIYTDQFPGTELDITLEPEGIGYSGWELTISQVGKHGAEARFVFSGDQLDQLAKMLQESGFGQPPDSA
jgi:hypothetical protein